MPLDGFQFKQSIRGIVERIAYQMGDAEPGAEFDGLDQNWIRARVFDTFKWLQGRRPDLFASEETLELNTSAGRQRLPPECDSILEIHSIQVAGKNYPVYMSDYEAIRAGMMYDKVQPACEYCYFHAATNPRDPDSFLISPPIRQPAVLKATCSNMSKFFDNPDTEIDCEVAKWINTVVEYVLYQAFSMDGDASSAEAESHRATFFDLAPVSRRPADAN